MSMPNIEYAEHRLQRTGTRRYLRLRVSCTALEPTKQFAGTYDAAWDRDRKPLLPHDFDRRFFNAASAGLVAPHHLLGNEPVVVIGVAPEGRVAFELPAIPPPVCVVELRGRNLVAAIWAFGHGDSRHGPARRDVALALALGCPEWAAQTYARLKCGRARGASSYGHLIT
jgi:hypothetical protein